MADAFKNLTDLAKINDAGVADYGITDLTNDAPVIGRLAADVSSNGTTHTYVKEVTAPTVGFRAVNTGRENAKSGDEQVTQALKILDASFSVDKAVADAYREGAPAYMAKEARRHLRAALFMAERQMWYGTGGGESGGFAGITDSLANADDAKVINAGGTTANTGTSVFLIRSVGDNSDLTAILGQDGEVSIGEPVTQALEDVTNGGRFTAYHVPILAWMGFQLGSIHSVVRIANLTADAGKGLTDDLISEALSLFPATRQPNMIVASRRSQKQLQQSRTATNATGAPAPFPTDAFGVDMVTTDTILDTESIITDA